MNVARDELSCIVHPNTNTLYAVAGNNGNEDVATIERYVINQTASNWQFTNGNLSKGVVQSRSVIYHDNIYVIGGFSGGLPSNAFSDCVHIIDTSANKVFVSPDPLSYKVSATSVIVFNDILYVFGGHNNEYNIHKCYQNRLVNYCLSTYVYYYYVTLSLSIIITSHLLLVVFITELQIRPNSVHSFH
eukprot:379670_1